LSVLKFSAFHIETPIASSTHEPFSNHIPQPSNQSKIRRAHAKIAMTGHEPTSVTIVASKNASHPAKMHTRIEIYK
jgi:hypothetical protein